MTERRKASKGKAGAKKPRLRKETIRDLDAKKSGKNVKGGWGVIGMTGACKTAACETANCVTIVGCGVLIG